MENKPYVETFGELAPQFVIELVADEARGAGLKLLLWDGTEQYIQPSLSLEPAPDSAFQATVFRAPEIDSSLVRAIRFPTHAAAYESDRELIEEVCTLIHNYTGLGAKLASLAAYSVLASWLVDCIETPICLSIVAAESTAKRQLFRLLGCLCRRALLLGDVTMAGVCSLPMALSPALFIEPSEPDGELQKLLRASRSRSAYLPRSGRLVNLCCAKVICSDEPLFDEVPGGFMVIPVAPSREPLPILDARAQKEIADRWQPKLLMYRLRNYKRAAASDFDVPQFAPPVRELARSLGACLSQEPDLQRGIVSLLLEQNEQIQSECAIDLNAIVVEAMLSLCHEEKKPSVHVAAIATAVNHILERRDELVEMKPRTVGHRLKALGLATQRLDSAGRGILLLEAIRQRVHALAWHYQTWGLPGSGEACCYCQEPMTGQESEADRDRVDRPNLDAPL